MMKQEKHMKIYIKCWTNFLKITKSGNYIYYKKMKREMKKYDIMYAGLNIRKMHKGWNRKAYLIGKDHFE